MERKRIRAHAAADFKPVDNFDTKLKIAIKKLQERMPEEWDTVLLYLRSKAVAVPLDPEQVETIKAEYHRKSQLVQLINKFQGFEGE